MTSLDAWIEAEARVAARELLRAVSAVGLTYQRTAFHQTITAKPGAVVASPVPGAYDPDPDYFFHWLRDSALAMDAIRVLAEAGALSHAKDVFAEFVRFGLALNALDGRRAQVPDRSSIAPEFARHLRPPEELARVHGDGVLAEARYNPDGTLDILNWARPQLDGPALRALTMLRAWPRLVCDDKAASLIRNDLAFVARHAFEPSFDIWEEDLGEHYYTRLVSAAALDAGAAWLATHGQDEASAAPMRQTAQKLWSHLDTYWEAQRGYYRAHRTGISAPGVEKDLDVSVILGILHARKSAGPHSVFDVKAVATLDRLCMRFAQDFPINAAHRSTPMLGRYRGDVYFGGGGWYIATLAAAEFHYKRGESARGDAFIDTVKAFTPKDGALSEQIDRATGTQTSAKHLGWSYAAFLTARAARAGALA